MLRLHFLNVGKGSSTIVEFPFERRVGIVDIDDSQSLREEDLEAIAELVGKSREYDLYKSSRRLLEARRIVLGAYRIELCDPVEYYKQNIGNRNIFRFILTHPDMDHMSGLKRLYDEVGFTNLWDTDNDKEVDDDSWESSPFRKEDWDLYQKLRQSTGNPKCIGPQRGDVNKYWDEDKIEVLSPSQRLIEMANNSNNYHHLSYVLKITHAGWNVLLGGDASVESWEDILENCGKEKLKADILLAPHHGSKNNFHKDAMEAVSPKLVIISVHVGKDYAYDEYARLKSQPKVLSTKWWGNIIVTIEESGKCTYDSQFDRG